MPDGAWGRIIAGAWLSLGAVWFLAALFTRRTIRRQDIAGQIAQTAITFASFWLLFATRINWGPLPVRILPVSQILQVIGCLLALAGIATAVVARLFLGRNWSSMPTVKEGHVLIRSGPYAIVRHPIYSGLLLAILGTAIFLGEVRGFLSLLGCLVAWKWKSLTEEAFMREQFGSQYDDYRRDVKALIPFVW